MTLFVMNRRRRADEHGETVGDNGQTNDPIQLAIAAKKKRLGMLHARLADNV